MGAGVSVFGWYYLMIIAHAFVVEMSTLLMPCSDIRSGVASVGCHSCPRKLNTGYDQASPGIVSHRIAG